MFSVCHFVIAKGVESKHPICGVARGYQKSLALVHTVVYGYQRTSLYGPKRVEHFVKP